jgi:hypothetical protein
VNAALQTAATARNLHLHERPRLSRAASRPQAAAGCPGDLAAGCGAQSVLRRRSPWAAHVCPRGLHEALQPPQRQNSRLCAVSVWQALLHDGVRGVHCGKLTNTACLPQVCTAKPHVPVRCTASPGQLRPPLATLPTCTWPSRRPRRHNAHAQPSQRPTPAQCCSVPPGVRASMAAAARAFLVISTICSLMPLRSSAGLGKGSRSCRGEQERQPVSCCMPNRTAPRRARRAHSDQGRKAGRFQLPQGSSVSFPQSA